jgi:hypothetical protein
MTKRNAIAFIDEAGEKGLIRNLQEDRDEKIGLLSSLICPTDRIDEFRAAFAPAFDRFKAEGGAQLEKTHITEAFKPGNESLREMAAEVRKEILKVILRENVPIIYCARRMRLLREAGEGIDDLRKRAKESRRATHIAVPARPSTARVEHDLFTGLVLRLDAFAQDFNLGLIELATDEIDLPVALGIAQSIDETRSLSSSVTTVKAYDLITKKPVQKALTVTVSAPFELDVKHIGKLAVVGKDDPLVFAADVIANSLNEHLLSLSNTSPLNAPSSIKGWAFEARVIGVLEDALEDLF